MATLQTQYLGMQLPNPFILASSPATANGKMIVEGFKAGWGGAVLKTLGLEPTTPTPSPRLFIMRDGREKRGMVNYELIMEITLDQWRDEMKYIRDHFPDRPVIASIMGGGQPRDWQEVIYKIEPCGVNAFELNVSCPNYSEERGAQLGQDPEALQDTIHWVKEATNLPIIVKLTPNVTDIVKLARASKEAGANGVTATNTVSGLAGIDLETFSPALNVEGLGIFGGYSGPGIKPISLRCAASIAKNVDIPLLGCGGISRWEDAAEYLAVGASAVEVCTAPMWNGYDIIKRWTANLEKFIETKGFHSPAEMVGKALPNIVTYGDINLNRRMVAHIDNENCNACGLCIKACFSGGFQAIDMIDKQVKVNNANCDGCGLCIGICPLGVIELVPRP